jgi:hypothetical protein
MVLFWRCVSAERVFSEMNLAIDKQEWLLKRNGL